MQLSAAHPHVAQDAKAFIVLRMSQRALTELLRGRGAHADPVACLEDISADIASRHVESFPHSIADLVFHMNYWMDYELRRIHGQQPKYPEHNSESFPTPSALDTAEWDRLRKQFQSLLAEFAALAQSPRAELDRAIESVHDADQKVAGTLEAVLSQMVAHNSYHVGQIATIRRIFGAWPPKAGGDTW
jgi:uncharacterized damage-inducible protein DinB